jgi:hypothetical protein
MTKTAVDSGILWAMDLVMTYEAFVKAAVQAGELKQDMVQLLASMEELVNFLFILPQSLVLQSLHLSLLV